MPAPIRGRHPALTALSEEERMFQSHRPPVRARADRPHVREMDEAGVFRKDLIRQFFELGLMGIEIPEEYGGQGGSFFQCDPGGGRAGGGGSFGGRDRRRAEHDLSTTPSCAGRTTEQKQRYLPAPGDATRSPPMRCRKPARVRRVRPGHARAEDHGDHFLLTGRKLWITNAAEAGLFLLFANANPGRGLQGHHRVSGRARVSRVSRSARKRTSWASAPRPPAS